MAAQVGCVAGCACVTYVFFSLVEWLGHRHLMHAKTLPAWAYRRVPSLVEVFEAHAIRIGR